MICLIETLQNLHQINYTKMIDKYTGSFHSPFFIFIKGLNHLSDEQILEFLEFDNCKIRNIEDDIKQSLFITRDKEWVHIMDNWWYNLWHSDSFRKKIDKLGEKYDLFYCSMGDCDYSFDVTYYKNGLLRRKYIVDDPDFKGGELIENIGKPLPFEEENLKNIGQGSKIISIAKSIGIETNHKLEEISCYQYDNVFIED